MTTTETSPMIVPDFGDDAEQRKMAYVSGLPKPAGCI